jgi:hypothetical protein
VIHVDKGVSMKRILRATIILSIVFILGACQNNNQNTDSDGYEKGDIILPVAMNVDSTDGEVKIPFETIDSDEEIVWSSDNDNIATVNEEGYITSHGNGSVIITASNGLHTSTMHVVATKDKYVNYTRIKSKLEFLFIFSNPENFNSPDQYYLLDTDIDFNGDSISPIGGWDMSNEETPIDPNRQFRATLDGRGYALKNFRIVNPISTKVDQYYFGVSLIPFIYDGKVLNLNIIDATFSGSGFTGSIAGKIEKGVIENCFVKATITGTLANAGTPSGGIAGIIGADALVKNVFLDVKVNSGFIYSGFNFGTGLNSNVVSKTLDDDSRRGPIRNTAITTNKGNEEEDAALKDFINSTRIEDDMLGDMNSYTFTSDAKDSVWTIKNGYMPFLIRRDGLTPSWAKISLNP